MAQCLQFNDQLTLLRLLSIWIREECVQSFSEFFLLQFEFLKDVLNIENIVFNLKKTAANVVLSIKENWLNVVLLFEKLKFKCRLLFYNSQEMLMLIISTHISVDSLPSLIVHIIVVVYISYLIVLIFSCVDWLNESVIINIIAMCLFFQFVV